MNASSLPRTVSLLEGGIGEGLHLGGQLYVSLRGEVIADLAFGEARPGEAMRRDHLMLWMSSTKPVGAVAICQLWERALLDLDDPVARHIPEFAAGGKEAVTVKHLLTHTGGIRMLDTGWPDADWDAIVPRICAMKLEPRWVPGETAGYHLASSWFILGELVRRLDGRPFERYTREEVFEPLGMDDCWIGMPVERYREYGERIAPMFDTERAPATPSDSTSEARLTRPSPGGNGCGPIRQLARLYECLLAGGSLDDARILSPETVASMTSRHRTGLMDKTFRHVLDWGLGVILNSWHYGVATVPYAYGPHASDSSYGHSGYRSSTAFADPERQLVATLAVNGMPADDTHRDQFNAATAAIYEDLRLV